MREKARKELGGAVVLVGKQEGQRRVQVQDSQILTPQRVSLFT
jgi:hypothetical protein